MKKLVKILLTFLICFNLGLFITVSAEEKVVVVGESKYKQGELVESNQLEGNLLHEKYTAYSSSGLTGFSAAGSGGGGTNIANHFYDQSVNILSIPTDTPTKVVNWTYQSNYGWALATVEQIAENFELHNPGWKVVAAINGDFFDINSKEALPLTTNGYFVSNGNVLKTSLSSSTAIGFTNNGTTETLVGSETMQVTDYYVLRVFNAENQEIHHFTVDNVNPETATDGITLYYSYPVFEKDENDQETTNRITISTILPSGAFISNNPENCIPIDDNGFYGKGRVEISNEDVELTKERFGVYTTREDVKNAISEGAYITIQRDVVGAYAECDNIVGCGVELVTDGKGVVFNNKERHPRTMVGVKEDGTLIFVTVDGRQPGDLMYGMTYDEQAALMEYYGAVEAYNLDGGGSTTMMIREGNEFRVLNSPSDGNPRRDANALLVVIPDASLKLNEVKDTSIKVSIPEVGPEINVENYVVNVDGKNYEIKDSLTITGLNSKSSYTINYSYKITYQDTVRNVTGHPIQVETGNIIPTLSNFTYKISDNNLIVNYNITDIDSVISYAGLYVNRANYDLDLSQNQIVVNNVSEISPEDITIVIIYSLNSSTTGAVNERISNPTLEPIEDSEKGCSSGAYFVSIIMLMSLCGVLVTKKK